MLRHILCAAVSAAVIQPVFAADPTPAEQDKRLREIEKRLERVESTPPKPAAAPSEEKKITSNTFNPAISLILNGTYSSFSRDPATYVLPGFALGSETEPGDEGLRLGESELTFSANIDDLFYGAATVALTPENETEVEEVFFETVKLGHGATIRAGRFLSHIGYLNNVHAHAWDFKDQPLTYRAMLANNYHDDGVQLRWVAPTDLLIEIGTEMFRGAEFPAGGAAKTGKGATTAFIRVGGDIGASHAWRIGLSRLNAHAANRATGDATAPDLFTGTSRLDSVDIVWKWSPNGNAKQTHFKFQAEYFRREENGTFDVASAGAPIDYRGDQNGWYAQAVYQFIPRWRAGLRRDKLESSNADASLAGTVLDNQGHQPKRMSAMVDFANSEFSRLRFQVNKDESRVNQKDTQWYLQYIMSLGAHGAHAF